MPKYPPQRTENYEKVAVDDWVTGQIEEVQLDKNHRFNFQGKISVYQGVRLKFTLDGYKFPHYSRWMKFSLGPKSNLFNKYISALVENAKPDMNIDVDCLQGCKVKIMWSEKTLNDGRTYQNVEMLRPLEAKVPWDEKWEGSLETSKEEKKETEQATDEQSTDESTVPF